MVAINHGFIGRIMWFVLVKIFGNLYIVKQIMHHDRSGDGVGVSLKLMGNPFKKFPGFEPSFPIKTSVTQGGQDYSPRVTKKKTEEHRQ